MKILFVIPEYPPHAGGGIVTFYRNLLPELVRLGHEPHALVGSAFSGKFDDYQSEGIKVSFLDPQAVQANLARFSNYRGLPELQKHLAAAWTGWEQANAGDGYDLVETTDWGMLFVPWIIERNSPPTVVQLHGSAGQINHHDPKRGEELQGVVTRLIETQLLACADELQTYSRNNAVEWRALTGREIHYIPPAWTAACSTFTPTEPSSHGLVVGRIQYWKGPTVICDALRHLGDRAPIIEWVGRDTPYEDSGLSMSDHLFKTYPDVWGSKLIPIGPRSPAETAALQQAAAFVVVPSTWDVLNYTCVEAMGRARVVACSEGAGACGLITDGEDGFTFASSDPAALAETILRVTTMTPESRRLMGEKAAATIEATVTPARVAKQRVEAYTSLVERGKESRRANRWIERDVHPQAPSDIGLAFLNHLPLKEISSYALNRTIKKFRN
jgi:glycosyltransferase involved in cell wall biosynthesis